MPVAANSPSTYRSPDGLTLVYSEFGPSGAPVVVLCHGLQAAGAQFFDDAEFFAKHGFRVLVPDLRGHGRSGRPETVSSDGFTRELMASDMVAMLEHAGTNKVHWVGNSLGGILALQMIENGTDRFETLAIFGTSPRLDLPPVVSAITWPYRIVGRRLTGWIAANATTRDRRGREIIARMVADCDPEMARALGENLRRYDLSSAALSYEGQMLILRGGRDKAVNLALDRWLPELSSRENVSVVHLPDGGHCANFDAREEWRAALIDFWAKPAN